MLLFKNIKTANLKYPSILSHNAVSLLKSLFVKDPNDRLGSGPKGAEEIKSHSFFKSIDWKIILNRKIKPPFLPKVNSEYDTPYIDEFNNMTPVDSLNGGDVSDNAEDYKEFSYNIDNNTTIIEKKDSNEINNTQ